MVADVEDVDVGVVLTEILVGGSDMDVIVVAVSVVVDTDGVGDLNDNGEEVKGGGRGAPFESPFTLRFSGGSSNAPLSFFRFLLVESTVTPCAAAAAACLAFSSCSSRD